MLIKIGIFFGLIIVAILGYAALRPAHYKISREILIKASPEIIFPHVNNSKMTYQWMPWQENYPGLEMVYSGPEAGVGSKSSWDSDTKMGKGESLIIENKLNEYVKFQLSYYKPMEMVQIANIKLIPEGSDTKVVWEVDGQNNYIGRVVTIFMDMDKMIGTEFMKGLVNLKSIVEAK